MLTYGSEAMEAELQQQRRTPGCTRLA